MLEFEEMVRMAKEEPEKLEAWRAQQIDDLINGAPPEIQQRLRGLQFTIDMHRRKASNPMAACIQLSRMMHESFDKMRTALVQFTGGEELEAQQPKSVSAAAVIPFGKK